MASIREWYPSSESTWRVQVGVEWNYTDNGNSISLQPNVLRWDSSSTDNYGSRFWEALSPDPSGAGEWSGLTWGSGSGTRVVDEFGTRVYQKQAEPYDVVLTVGWDEQFGTHYNGSFHNVGSDYHAYRFTIPAATAPSAPTNLSYTRVSDNRVNLSWTASPSAHSAVCVERQVDGGSWSQISVMWTQGVSSWTDSTTSADHSYKYRVRVWNDVYYSAYATSDTVITMTPSAPTSISLARVSGSNNVAVTLTNPSNTATSLVWEKRQDGTDTWVTGGTVQGKVSSFTAQNLGGVYYIRVKNVNATSSSAWLVSESITTITKPNPPTLIEPSGIVDMSAENVVFTWLHNTVDGSAQSAAELRYKVGSGSYTTVSLTTASTYELAMSTFSAGNTVTWQVRTKGAHADYSNWSDEKQFTLYQVPSLTFVANNPPSTVSGMPIPCQVTYNDPQNMACAYAEVALYEGSALKFSEPMTINGNTLSASLSESEFLPENGKTYTVTVTARSGSTLQSTANTTFDVSYTPPKKAEVQISNDPETGHVTLLVKNESNKSGSGNPAVIYNIGENESIRTVVFEGSCQRDNMRVKTTCGIASGTGANLAWPSLDVLIGSEDTTAAPIAIANVLNNTYLAGLNGANDKAELALSGSKITRKIGCVDLGTLTWVRQTSGTLAPYFYATISGIKSYGDPASKQINALCDTYDVVAFNAYEFLDETICGHGSTTQITQLRVKHNSYTDAAAFKAAVSGKLCYYELETPVEVSVSTALSDGASLQAEENGTLTFENTLGDSFRIPVPNASQFAIHGATWTTQDGTTPAYAQSVPIDGHKAYVNMLGGKTVAWNQLFNAIQRSTSGGGVSITSDTSGNLNITGTSTQQANLAITAVGEGSLIQNGHKYYLCIPEMPNGSSINFAGLNPCTQESIFTVNYSGSATLSMRITFSSGITFDLHFKPQLFDLTRIFGAGNEPATVAEFRAMFPAAYYVYDAGSLKNAAVENVKSMGKNILEGYNLQTSGFGCTYEYKQDGTVTLNGTATANNGVPSISDIISRGWAFMLDAGTYTLSASEYNVASGCLYNVNGTIIKSIKTNASSFTLEERTECVFRVNLVNGNVYNNKTVGFMLERGTTATAYTPYMSDNLEIPSTVRAMCPNYGASAGSVYNYIDWQRRKYVQRVGSVDLGSLTWSYNSSVTAFAVNITAKKVGRVNLECGLYTIDTTSAIASLPNMSIAGQNGSGDIYAKNTSYTDAAAFKTAMSGVMLNYELATPVEVDLSGVLPAKSSMPHPTAYVSLDGAISTPLTASCASDGQDFTSIQVFRVSDHRKQLLDSATVGQSFVDVYAPLNTDYTYEVVTRAASGAIAVNGISNRLVTNRWFAYWGANIAYAIWNPEEGGISIARPERKHVRYSGRKYPVSYDGIGISESRSMDFTIIDKERIPAFKQLMNDGGRGVFKGCDGQVVNADFDVTVRPEYMERGYYGGISVDITRISGDEL